MIYFNIQKVIVIFKLVDSNATHVSNFYDVNIQLKNLMVKLLQYTQIIGSMIHLINFPRPDLT